MILLLVIIAMWKRLKLVVALFHEAGKCVIAMPLLLIQPVWTFIVLIAFVAYWLVVLAFIGTSGESVSECVCRRSQSSQTEAHTAVIVVFLDAIS